MARERSEFSRAAIASTRAPVPSGEASSTTSTSGPAGSSSSAATSRSTLSASSYVGTTTTAFTRPTVPDRGESGVRARSRDGPVQRRMPVCPSE